MISTQVEELKKVVKAKYRKSMNFTGISDREKDKAKLFETYDKERAERAILEILGEDSKLIDRPIRRTGVSKY